MEIPTKEILERLDSRLVGGIAGPIALDAIDTINAQAKEIEELQAVIVRLRDELQGADRELRILTNELNKMEGA